MSIRAGRADEGLLVPAAEVVATIEELADREGMAGMAGAAAAIAVHVGRDPESVERGLRQMRRQGNVTLTRAETLLIGLGATAHELPSYRRAMNQYPPPVQGWCASCAERVLVDGRPLRCLWCGAKASRIERVRKAAA